MTASSSRFGVPTGFSRKAKYEFDFDDDDKDDASAKPDLVFAPGRSGRSSRTGRSGRTRCAQRRYAQQHARRALSRVGWGV